jgi:hypothetical protein
MRVYIGFDDTDVKDADRGTGKLARWFEKELLEGCSLWGVVRQQLLVHDAIPYTSHNSSACVVVDMAEVSLLDQLTTKAIEHVERYSFDGSDPGVCVACEGHSSMLELTDFGRSCTRRVVTQKEALRAASGVHLSGHGGTDDGIIGAAAAVGLTASGWSGRLIEFNGLRNFPDVVPVADLERSDMLVVSLDRNAEVPSPEDLVHTKGWLRPRLWGNRAVVSVKAIASGIWESLGEKQKKTDHKQENARRDELLVRHPAVSLGGTAR